MAAVQTAQLQGNPTFQTPKLQNGKDHISISKRHCVCLLIAISAAWAR
jgi:hypothetical protein